MPEINEIRVQDGKVQIVLRRHDQFGPFEYIDLPQVQAQFWSSALASAIGVFATGVSYPEPVARATLGPDWQCSRLAFVFTTCSRAKHTEAMSVRVAKNAMCARLRT